MTGFSVTLVQQPLLWHDPAANRAQFARLLEPFAGRTDLIVLPETFTTGFSMEVERCGEPAAGETCDWLLERAARLDAAVTGSVITVADGRYYNRLLFATPDGELRHYDKRHLFRMGREHEHFTPGRAAVVLKWRGLEICPLVCYDLRFPVFSRRRPELDYELLVYVANWPAPRGYAWTQLLRARAIENQAYVVGVNRVGPDGAGVDYAGGSAALDCLGRPLAELGSEPALVTVALDVARLRAFRETFPAHLDADRFALES